MSRPLHLDPAVVDELSPVMLRAGRHRFELPPGAPAVMGIVNTNPGSFSDRTHLTTTEEQFALAMRHVEAGAAIIDVGADSGVTYGVSVPLDVQVRRAVRLTSRLVDAGVPVSVDTPFTAVAEAVLDAGAALINDVSGLADPKIAERCAVYGAALVILHTRVGHKRESYRHYPDVVADIEELFEERIAVAVERGLPRERIVLDPGLGYAKLPEDDLRVLRAYPRFAALGSAILTGASRKYFAGVVTGHEPAERLPETLATVETVRAFPGFVRVHDVDEVARFLAVRETLDGRRSLPVYDTADESLKWVQPAVGSPG